MTSAWRFSPRVFAVPDDPDLDALVAALAPRRGLWVLDSAGGQPRRESLVAFDPLETLSLECPDESGSGRAAERGGWIDALRALGERLVFEPSSADVPGPFRGGLLVALAYDLGVWGERAVDVDPEPWRLPWLQAGLYVDFFVRDEPSERTWLVLGDQPGDGRASVGERRAALFARLAERERPATERSPAAGITARGPLVRHVPSRVHAERIERARAAIGRGEIYQANLAHRFTREIEGAPSALYRRLRAVNPAPYMTYVEAFERAGRDPEAPDPQAPQREVGWQPAWAILSASPELLVEIDASGSLRTARTRPIKGTIARAADEAEDARRRAALLASAKDRAELTMIVDLERNDLGRIARPGRVWVEHFPVVQSYPALHHLVGDVVCEPREDVDAWDIVAALFPGGSITGAPKLAAMQQIATLEGQGRGFFTGSVGFVDTRGQARFNILIRTLLWRARGAQSAEGPDAHGEVSFRVGGGITWESDAAAEDAETLVKAERLIAALSADFREPAQEGAHEHE